jgi:hypothetical protein
MNPYHSIDPLAEMRLRNIINRYDTYVDPAARERIEPWIFHRFHRERKIQRRNNYLLHNETSGG